MDRDAGGTCYVLSGGMRGKADDSGVPTVVDGATIVHDAIAHLLENLEEAEMEEFLQELITPRLHRMFVTPKDVDETVKRLSYTISEGINIAMEA